MDCAFIAARGLEVKNRRELRVWVYMCVCACVYIVCACICVYACPYVCACMCVSGGGAKMQKSGAKKSCRVFIPHSWVQTLVLPLPG